MSMSFIIIGNFDQILKILYHCEDGFKDIDRKNRNDVSFVKNVLFKVHNCSVILYSSISTYF